MKQRSFFVMGLGVASLLAGYLLSAISFVGRAGIDLFYTQYHFLKTWWKGALLVFIVWIILFGLQALLQTKVKRSTSIILQCALLLVAVVRLFMSYADFRNSLSHRWLGERFHLGVYLFWLGWIAIEVFMLSRRERLANYPAMENQSPNPSFKNPQ